MDCIVSQLQSEKVIVKKLILIRVAVGGEKELLPIRRPIYGMLVVVALGKLADLPGSDIHNEKMQALIVVEMRKPFARRGLVKIAGDDHRITTRRRTALSCFGRDEGDLLSIRRPGKRFPGTWQRRIGA